MSLGLGLVVVLGVYAGVKLLGPRSVCVRLYRSASSLVSAALPSPFRGAAMSRILADT